MTFNCQAMTLLRQLQALVLLIGHFTPTFVKEPNACQRSQHEFHFMLNLLGRPKPESRRCLHMGVMDSNGLEWRERPLGTGITCTSANSRERSERRRDLWSRPLRWLRKGLVVTSFKGLHRPFPHQGSPPETPPHAWNVPIHLPSPIDFI